MGSGEREGKDSEERAGGKQGTEGGKTPNRKGANALKKAQSAFYDNWNKK